MVSGLDVPPVDKWINGELSVGQIRELNIEDLLGRKPIALSAQAAANSITGKRICITGAAGSIGSEIVRQILVQRPSAVLAIDQAETPLHDLHVMAGPEVWRPSISVETFATEPTKRLD